MNTQSLKDTIRRELPEIMRTDPDFRGYILALTRQEYAGRAATDDRFYELLAELRRDREEGVRKWDEHQAEQREEFKRIHEEIMAQAQRHDRSIGALGSRWGLQSEKAFRDALEVQALRGDHRCLIEGVTGVGLDQDSGRLGSPGA